MAETRPFPYENNKEQPVWVALYYLVGEAGLEPARPQ